MNCYYSYPHSRKQGWLCFWSALTNSSLSKLCSIMMWSTFVSQSGVGTFLSLICPRRDIVTFWQGRGGGGVGGIDCLILDCPPIPKSIVQSNPASRTPAQYGHLIIMDAHLIWTPHLITDTLLCPWEKSSYIFSKFNPLNTDSGFTKYEHFL